MHCVLILKARFGFVNFVTSMNFGAFLMDLQTNKSVFTDFEVIECVLCTLGISFTWFLKLLGALPVQTIGLRNTVNRIKLCKYCKLQEKKCTLLVGFFNCRKIISFHWLICITCFEAIINITLRSTLMYVIRFYWQYKTRKGSAFVSMPSSFTKVTNRGSYTRKKHSVASYSFLYNSSVKTRSNQSIKKEI